MSPSICTNETLFPFVTEKITFIHKGALYVLNCLGILRDYFIENPQLMQVTSVKRLSYSIIEAVSNATNIVYIHWQMKYHFTLLVDNIKIILFWTPSAYTNIVSNIKQTIVHRFIRIH